MSEELSRNVLIAILTSFEAICVSFIALTLLSLREQRLPITIALPMIIVLCALIGALFPFLLFVMRQVS
jgi:hypothetical protein